MITFRSVQNVWTLEGTSPSPSFVALLAELSRPSDDFLQGLAKIAADGQIEYLAFIGPDAEAAHDRLDLAIIRELEGRTYDVVPMTVWSEAQSLDESIRLLADEHWDVMRGLGDICIMGHQRAEWLIAKARLAD